MFGILNKVGEMKFFLALALGGNSEFSVMDSRGLESLCRLPDCNLPHSNSLTSNNNTDDTAKED
jgi:hypothetical protein